MFPQESNFLVDKMYLFIEFFVEKCRVLSKKLGIVYNGARSEVFKSNG